MNGTDYKVYVCEPTPHTDERGNLDCLEHEPPPCPLCGSAYVSLMAHHGPSVSWLECFLGHCVEVHWDTLNGDHHVEITDKPRYVLTMAINWVVVEAKFDRPVKVKRAKKG